MSDGIDTKRLQTLVERAESVIEEQKSRADDLKEIMAEAKASGLEPKYIKRAIKDKNQDSEKRKLEEAEYQLYKDALNID